MLTLRGVSVTLGQRPVLQDFSLRLPLSGVTALSGPSGSGKTTLLRVLCALQAPDCGTVEGIDAGKTALLFQENRLLPRRTALQQVRDVLPRAQQAQAMDWLALTELAPEAHKYPRELSGGMQRRLALSRALALGGALYVLDEPFAGVDTALARRIMERVRALGTPVLLVSHEPAVLELADRVVQLDGPPLRCVQP